MMLVEESRHKAEAAREEREREQSARREEVRREVEMQRERLRLFKEKEEAETVEREKREREREQKERDQQSPTRSISTGRARPRLLAPVPGGALPQNPPAPAEGTQTAPTAPTAVASSPNVSSSDTDFLKDRMKHTQNNRQRRSVMQSPSPLLLSFDLTPYSRPGAG